jgi:formiminotetrahydrofolate cyclodeaminase
MALADRSLAELLEAVATATPAPGGGTSVAWTCALAAALAQMAGAPAGRAGELRARALALAEDELGAYAPVLEAQRLPGDDPLRGERIDAALARASDSPLEIARVAAEVATLAARAAAGAGPALRGDAAAGALLAEAACRAAARLVEINLADRPDDERLARAAELVGRAADARRDALGGP